MTTQNNAVKAVILAGGSGTRLWPLSRQQLPKQFLRLDGRQGLLETTIQRLQPLVALDDVLIVTASEHAYGEAYSSLSGYRTLLEPVGRNTAPAIALAARWLQHSSGGADPIMLVLPADHVIRDVQAFHQVLQSAIKLASTGALVTLGIKASSPDTGFGYIKSGKEISKEVPQEYKAYRVERFVEKPDLATAEEYVKAGNYHWNSGMFVWKTSKILEAIAEHLPDVTRVLDSISAQWSGDAKEMQKTINEHFAEMPSISIDYGVLEKLVGSKQGLYVIPCELAWSDVGSWDAVHDILPQDENANALYGNAQALDCKNTLIHANHRLVAALGVEDLCIVETADAILVAKKGQTQRVREIVDGLKKIGAQEHKFHLTVNRPWGMYTVLEELPGFKMKRITVNPGAALSLQRHQHRSEHWIVVSGTATVTCDGVVSMVSPNQSTYIPVGSLHRLENRGKIALQMVEVQVGEYLEEDDIERFDDKYDRPN